MSRRSLNLPSARSRTPDAGEQDTLIDVPAAPVVRGQDDGVVHGMVGMDTTTVVSVASLPTPYDVSAAEIESPLSAKQRGDLRLCEQALHGFRKALVVAGKALEVINRGRLYRETHGTFEDYVEEVWGFKRAHAYRLIDEWPVAVAVSPIGDINEAQARELLPVVKKHGQDAAVAVYREARELSGGKVTAAALAEARKVLPKRLEVPEQAADVLRVAAAEGRVPLIVPPRVQVTEQVPPPTGEDVLADGVRAGAQAVAVLEAALAQQQQIYDNLAGTVALAQVYDPGRAEMLLHQLRQYAHRTMYRARGRSGGNEDQGDGG